MATFEQRESGWWQAKIRRKGHPVQSKTFPSKRDAEIGRASLSPKWRAGSLSPGQKQSA